MPKQFNQQFLLLDFPGRLWKYPDVQNCAPMSFPISDPHRPLGIRDKHGKAANRSLHKLTKGVYALEVNNKI